MGKSQTKAKQAATDEQEPAPAPAADEPAAETAPAKDEQDADPTVDEAPAADEPASADHPKVAPIKAKGDEPVLIGDGHSTHFRVEHALKADKVDIVVTKKLTGQPVPVEAKAAGKGAVVVDFDGRVPGVDTFLVTITKA